MFETRKNVSKRTCRKARRRWHLALAGLVLAGQMGSVAFASGPAATAGNFYLNGVTVENGQVYLRLQGNANFNNPDSCQNPAMVVIMPDSLYPGIQNQWYSLAITAITSNKPVYIWLVGCTQSVWAQTVPVVESMSFYGS